MVRLMQYLVILLGSWLCLSSFIFSYESEIYRWSDRLCGVLSILVAFFSLSQNKFQKITYFNSLLGLWLLFAPLFFWAPHFHLYLNDTLVGAALITVSLVIPMSVWRSHIPGPEIPHEWSYNPSAWAQRLPIVLLALINVLISSYLAMYQLGYVDNIWDPFFGKGTINILESDVSKAFMISDAGLGSLSYLLDALAGVMGNKRRWHTMPWMVILFGLLIIPTGIVAIGLIILQPIAVGAWCTLCLVTAAITLLMIPPAIDEVLATIQFLKHESKVSGQFWSLFWKGGTPQRQGEQKDGTSKASLPWTMAVSVVIGIWVMASPTVLRAQGWAADSNHFVGPLIITFAVIAMSEVGRPVRLVNLFLSLWLMGGTWFLSGSSFRFQWITALSGVLIFLLNLPTGKVQKHYGVYDRYIRWAPIGRKS